MAETVTSGTCSRPSADDFAEHLAPVLRVPCGSLRLAPLGRVVPRPDAAAVLRVSDSSGSVRAVLMCSSPDAPGMVVRAMQHAQQARSLLPAETGRHILEPLAQGRVHGLSYALLPLCEELAHGRLAWRVQRQRLAPALFEWLRQLHAATVRDLRDEQIEPRFLQPLHTLAAQPGLSDRVHADARRAAKRLEGGAWQPRTVLMHGDLWKGNVLLRPAASVAGRWQWPERFVVIDWPGSDVCGHAIYDLVRLAQSMRLRSSAFDRELRLHCELLGCERADAMGHLLAALGRMAKTLEHFPHTMFATMVDACHATLAAELA